MMKEKISVLIADDIQDFSHTLANYIEGQDDMFESFIIMYF